MKEVNEYFIGLDIGTNSIGWAVTDTNYNVLKFNNKAMWGVRSFDEAKTAVERRTFRANRRRLHRRRERIKLLQEIFAKEIYKIDPTFYQRLNNSKFYLEDKDNLSTINIFFNDKNFKDKDYYKKYPTIYHLRKDIIDGKESDIRLIYLAIHHIIKYRGHFLFDGDNINTNYDELFNSFIENLRNILGREEFSCDKNKLKEILEKKEKKSVKEENIRKIFNATKKDTILSLISKLLTGASTDISNISENENEKITISFSSSDYDEKRQNAIKLGDDICDFLDSAKALYDYTLLSKNLQGKNSISESKIEIYENHKKDLKKLKEIIKKYAPKKYQEIFKSKTGLYSKYAGHKNSEKRIKRDDEFYKKIKNILKEIGNDSENLIEKIENETFMPLQTYLDNSVIPHQIHFAELEKILEKASNNHPFLKAKDSDNISNIDKIKSIFKFRIPYYVGPLNTKSDFSWVIRKEDKITPWNFKDIVNEELSAVKFIERMTNKCTYLRDKNVLPKNSLLYKEYTVLNELNNLKINGEKLPLNIKIQIINKLFKEKIKVTGKAIVDFYEKEYGEIITTNDISGIDKDFTTSLSSYLDFKKKVFKGLDDKLEDKKYIAAIEEIINWITIFNDNSKFVKNKIEQKYKNLFSDEEIKSICSLKYSGWGNFSKEFLVDIEAKDKKTGQVFNIINGLRETNNNLMELLSDNYTFLEKIALLNKKEDISSITYENCVEDTYLSPAIKRAVWQTITITEEIRKIIKKEPTKIFVEMARGSSKTGRTQSRKNKLEALYKNIKGNEYDELEKDLNNSSENELQNKRLYLYFIQLGKCMYSGDPISLHEISTDYEIDHIIPQSKIKDDSFDNVVLVKKMANQRKGAVIIPDEIRKKMNNFWKSLKDKNFISAEKYNRLTRSKPYTDDELSGFINRQLVETSQSTKAVTQIFKNIYKDSKVIYIKARNVSDFRKEFNFIKSRTVNDHHHAKDAYLNIVVGNVWNTKFTSNARNFIRNNQNYTNNFDYDLRKLYDKDLGKNSVVWKAGESGTIETIEKYMSKNNVLYTRYAYTNKGQFWNDTIAPKKNKLIPIKKGMDTSKYGGYTSIKPAYFIIVKSIDKKKIKYTIERVPIYLNNRQLSKNDIIEYLKNDLQLKEPEIIQLSEKSFKLKKNTLINYDGKLSYITGRTGGKIEIDLSYQFILKEFWVSYISVIEKFIEKYTKDKNKTLKINNNLINKEDNSKLYKELIIKSKSKIYDGIVKTKLLESNYSKFLNLSLEEQCKELLNIVLMFTRKKPSVIFFGKEEELRDRPSCIITNKNIVIINQSPTGLFEEKITVDTKS